MNRREYTKNYIIDSLGLRPNEENVARYINRQNMGLMLAIMVLNFMSIIFWITKHAMAGSVKEGALFWEHGFIYTLLTIVSLLALAGIRYERKTGFDKQWKGTLMVYAFAIIEIHYGFYEAMRDMSHYATMTAFCLTCVWSLVLLNIRPVVTLVTLACFNVIASATYQHLGLHADVVAVHMVLITIIIVSIVRYNLTRKTAKENAAVHHLQEELMQVNHLLREESRTDELTRLKNRFALRDDFDGYVGDALMVMMVDIDEFKSINDTFGHEVGDSVIRSFGRALKKVFGEEPCYRYGGDEFLVIDYYEKDKFEHHRDKVQDILAGLMIPGTNEPVHFSIGYTVGECKDEEDLRNMLRVADENLYQAKETKGNAMVGNNAQDADDAPESQLDKDGTNKVIPAYRLRRLREMFEALDVVSADQYVFICDMEFDYSIWSKNAVEDFGLPSEVMYQAGQQWTSRIHPDDREPYVRSLDEIFGGTASSHDTQYRALNVEGNYVICSCRGVVVRKQDGSPIYFGGSIRNYGNESSVDALSGLRSKEGFYRDLATMMDRQRPTYLLLMGLYDYSKVNDLYGYEFGNQALAYIGRKFNEAFGHLGYYYRLDGTHSILISHDADKSTLMATYQRMKYWSEHECVVGGKQLSLQLSGSLMHLTQFHLSAQTVMASLNDSYKVSKTERQGALEECVQLEGDFGRERLEFTNDIRLSIINDCKGFELFYQPLMDTTDEVTKVRGVEALIRWRHEKYGLVMPGRFIQFLEVDSLYPVLGEWILRRAMEDGKKFLEVNPDFIVNVNIAQSQLLNKNFTETVERLLKETNFPPKNLCLEITERCRTIEFSILRSLIAELKGLGVRFAMDDFGIGYSSVGLLRRLAFDLVKLDREFIRDIQESTISQQAIKEYVHLARVYGAKVCAEGIESKEVQKILRKQGVICMQGFYYSKPVPFEELLAWYKKRKEEVER